MRRGKVEIFSAWARWRAGIDNNNYDKFFRRIRNPPAGETGKMADNNRTLKYMGLNFELNHYSIRIFILKILL